MSGKAGSGISIALGALLIVGTIASAGSLAAVSWQGWITIGASLLTISAGVYGVAFAPKAPSPEGARANELQYATASEGQVVPVVFGEVKVTGNFMRYETTNQNFRSVAVYQDAQVGKGGGQGVGATIIGYNYYLTYEYALCMGPVDAIGQIWSQPGETPMRGTDPAWVIFGSNEYKNIDDLSSHDQGGSVRVYKGSKTQNRIAASDPYTNLIESGTVTTAPSSTTFTCSTLININDDFYAGYQLEITAGTSAGQIRTITDYVGASRTVTVDSNITLDSTSQFKISNPLNYRNVCWVLFKDYKIGRAAQPLTNQFMVRRLPVCVRDDTTTVSGLLTRGSANTDDPAYNQANPAAIIYEVITNKLWGAALSSDIINEQSFIDASVYFQSKNIGMSFLVDSPDKFSSLLDGIRLHVKTILVWDGEQIKIKCLLDPAVTNAKIQTLKKSDLRNFQFTRPQWSSTFNEIRAEFNDRERNYRARPVHMQDVANINTVGRINSQKIQLFGFTDYNIVRRQLVRILRENSYPLGTATAELNRFKSQVEIGDVLRLEYDEWSSGTVTYYFDVIRMEEADSNDDWLKVYLSENIHLSAINGTETGNLMPDEVPWFKITDLDSVDTNFNTPNSTDKEAINPVTLIEAAPAYTRLQAEISWILGQRPSQGVVSMNCYWINGSSLGQLGNQSSFAITGSLTNGIYDGSHINRSPSGFLFSLTNPSADEADILADATQCQNDTDNIEDMIRAGTSVMVIGDEIMLIGKVEKVDTNSYRARNIVRGFYGTQMRPHYPDDKIFYVVSLPTGLNTSVISSNKGSNPQQAFKAYPVGTAGETPAGDPFYPAHYGAYNTKYLAQSIRPMSPVALGVVSVVKSPSWSGNFQLKPRWINRGAGVLPILGSYDSSTNLMTGEISHYQNSFVGYGVRYAVFNMDGTEIKPPLLTGTSPYQIPTASSILMPGYYVFSSYSITNPSQPEMIQIFNLPLGLPNSTRLKVRFYMDYNNQTSPDYCEITVS